MLGEFVLFLLFALTYTAAWWLVMRASLPVVRVHDAGDVLEERARRATHANEPPERAAPILATAETAVASAAPPPAASTPVPTRAVPDASPPLAPVDARSAEEPPPASVAPDEPASTAPVASTPSTAITPSDRERPHLPEREPVCAPSSTTEPMNAQNDSKPSNPLEFPNWMEEDTPSSPTPESATEAGPQASSGAASDPVQPPKLAFAPVPTPSTGSARAATTPGGAGESLRGLSRIEKERMQVMAQLDTWARAWADVEERNAQCVDELSRQVEALAQEHSQCDGRYREVEQRAQQQSARSTELDRELTTAHSELDKLEDHLTRSQDATKEATARELDWQQRYHEDTGKLMQQLTAKSQECERWVGENQKQKGEIDKQTRELRGKDELVQSISLRCSDLDQRATTQAAALEEKDARIAELGQQIAELQKELAQHLQDREEQSSMLQAAQGVLAELQPKLMQLEKRLAKH